MFPNKTSKFPNIMNGKKEHYDNYTLPLTKALPRNILTNEKLPQFSQFQPKSEFDFMMKGACNFCIYARDRTPFKQLISDGPLNHRYYVAINSENFYKVLFTQVLPNGEEREIFGHWIYSEMEIKHNNCRAVYLAKDTVDGYQYNVSVQFPNTTDLELFVSHFNQGIENHKVVAT